MFLRWPLALTETALAVVWEELELGDLPRPLFVPSPGATEAERARVNWSVASELSRIGIGIGDGSVLDRDLEAALRLLAKPAVEYYGWIELPGSAAYGVVVAANAQYAVLATRSHGAVRLRPVDPACPPWALVAELPPQAAAAGQAFRATRGAPEIQELIAPPLTGTGQLFVAMRDKLGRRTQFARPIDYADSRQGRWLFHGLAGDELITVVPGDPQHVATALHEAYQQLIGQAHRDSTRAVW